MRLYDIRATGVAIACSLTWSLAVILFKKAGDDVHPILLNLAKNLVGLVLMIPTIYLVEGSLRISAAPGDVAVLVLSGLLGIGLADAMVLKALKDIGASRIAIVECTYSPFVILLSLLFLGEHLSGTRLMGALLVIGALFCVSVTRDARKTASGRPPHLVRGMLWGLAGLFSMAGGIVMTKPIFATVSLFQVIGIRLSAGVVASAALFAVLPRKKALVRTLFDVPRRDLMLTACVLSTYVSMTLWIASYKYNDAGIAAVLNQTSTIFTVIFAAIFLKERLTPLKIAGTMLATTGVLLMVLA
jgi:drug/metabolite transporter (DMT)-like permease